jgi:DNA circularisation protein N-terminus
MSRDNCAIGKDYVPASFKGVGFVCTDADIEGGRRGAEGEFPFGEVTAYADLGRKIRVFNLTAVFRENDHVSDSSALFAVCESPQPGILVHPTRGTHLVACRKVKVSDKVEAEAGQTTADLEFVEANPVGTGIGSSIFGIISSFILSVSAASFRASYVPLSIPRPWQASIVNSAQHLATVTHDVLVQTFDVDTDTTQARAALRLEEVAHDAGLAVQADVIDDAISEGLNIIAQNIEDADTRWKTFRTLANHAAKSSSLPVSSGAAAVEDSLFSRFRILTGVAMAEAAMARTYPYIQAALDVMDATTAVLEDEARAAYDICDNGLYLEIRKYIINFQEMMHDLAYRLPGLIVVDFQGGVHPLVAAYTIYKDAKRHRDLEPRNVLDANGRFGRLVRGVAPA